MWGLPFYFRFPWSPSLFALAVAFLAFFRQRVALQFEILALRHQLGVLHRSVKRPKLMASDRFLKAWLAAVRKDWQPCAFIMKPATVMDGIGYHYGLGTHAILNTCLTRCCQIPSAHNFRC